MLKQINQQLIIYMMNKPSSSSSDRTTKQNEYIFNIDSQRQIEISSNFENGNIALVKQIHELYYILQSVSDVENVPSKKAWFYFRMKSNRGIKVRIIIQNVSIYETIFQEKYHCKPFFKEGQSGSWNQLTESFLTYRDQIVLVIDHTFKNSEEVYFCLTIPFTYSDNERYLEEMKMNIHPNIEYSDQIFALTPQNRNVHLLTITEKQQKIEKNEKKLGDIQSKKPVIMITSRVHPGEVSSSYCLQGLLEFLLSYNNLQAWILRRLFTFKIIPMVNPDGVYEGNYRMDPLGNNLNRFYNEPSAEEHPAIFKIKELMKNIGIKQKIQFYFDLHSHSSMKQAFIYGNALQDIVLQTYSELFCKILEENYPRFKNNLSCFDERHMKHKDKGEQMSKQGCGRVVINKLYGVIQSYTVQSSIFPAAYDIFSSKSPKNEEKNKDFTQLIDGQMLAFEQIYYSKKERQNIIVRENKLLGRNILVSILDMIKKNPYSRMSQQFNNQYCKDYSQKLLQNEDRFKLIDIKAYQKSKMIGQMIKVNIQQKIQRIWNLLGLHSSVNSLLWPNQFRKISVFQDITNKESKSVQKNIRVKTEGKEKITINNTKSLRKPKKYTQIPAQVKQNNFQTHRQMEPNSKQQTQIVFPQIKYSIEVKSQKQKDSLQLKVAAVKQMHLNVTQTNTIVFDGEKVKKRMILDYIQQEINKINPDKQIFKRSNASLNRLIANKIIEKERSKNRASQMSEYKRIIIQSRKRIATECKQVIQEDAIQVKILKQKFKQEVDQEIKALDYKKSQVIKKRFLTANKAIQIVKRNDKTKVKLPDLNKLSLIVKNSKNERQRHTFLDETYARLSSENPAALKRQ